MENKVYDIIIVGSGPAGLSAGLYAARAKMDTLIIEKGIPGGQIAATAHVENYPGAPDDTTGAKLTMRMAEQTKEFGAENITGEVVEIDVESNPKLVKTKDNEYKAKALILATGTHNRLLNAEGEKEFIGRGVSFCATCDGPFAENMHVYVVGGGDSAVEEAMFVAKFARQVTIIHRRDELRAAKSLQDQCFVHDNIDYMWDSEVIKVEGDMFIESFTVRNKKTGEETVITPSDGDPRLFLFVFIGLIPNSELFEGKIELDEGYVVTDETMKTSVEGVYAAGDVRKTPFRQVVTATSDGAIAANEAAKYVESVL